MSARKAALDGIYKASPLVVPIRKEVVTGRCGRRFDVSTVEVRWIFTPYDMLITRLGVGEHLYAEADYTTQGKGILQSYIDGIAEHMEHVNMAVRGELDDAGYFRRTFRRENPRHRSLPLLNDLSVGDDIVLSPTGIVYRISTTEFPSIAYVPETLVTCGGRSRLFGHGESHDDVVKMLKVDGIDVLKN